MTNCKVTLQLGEATCCIDTDVAHASVLVREFGKVCTVGVWHDHPASEPRLRVFTDEDSGDSQCSQPFYWFEVRPDTFLWAQNRGEARLLCQNHVEVTHSLQEIKSMFSNVKEYFGEV